MQSPARGRALQRRHLKRAYVNLEPFLEPASGDMRIRLPLQLMNKIY